MSHNVYESNANRFSTETMSKPSGSKSKSATSKPHPKAANAPESSQSKHARKVQHKLAKASALASVAEGTASDDDVSDNEGDTGRDKRNPRGMSNGATEQCMLSRISSTACTDFPPCVLVSAYRSECDRYAYVPVNDKYKRWNTLDRPSGKINDLQGLMELDGSDQNEELFNLIQVIKFLYFYYTG
jgi:hypothetical protein